DSIKSRYNNNAPGSKTDFQTDTYDQAQMFIENMALTIDAAEELIDSGKALTIDNASNMLAKGAQELINDSKSPTLGIPMNSVEGKQALIDGMEEVKNRDEKTLEKNKAERIKKAKDAVQGTEAYLRKPQSGAVAPRFSGEPATVEVIEQPKQDL